MLERILGAYPLGGIVDKDLLQEVEEENQELVARGYYFLGGVSKILLSIC